MKTLRNIFLIALAMVLCIAPVSFALTERLGAVRYSFNPTKILNKTAAYTVTTSDVGAQVNVNATSAAVTITLPSIADVYAAGQTQGVVVKKTDSSVNTVTLSPASSNTIGGESARVIVNQNGWIAVRPNGLDWIVDYESPYVVEDHEAGTSDLGTQSYDASIVFEGATANDYETTLAVTDPTADATWQIPAATAGTYYVMSTALSTNYVDAANAVTGASNGILMEGATADAYELTITTADVAADRTATFPDATGTVMLTSLATNSADAANAVTGTSNGLLLEGATADAYELTITTADITAVDKTVTFPDGTGTVMLTSLATNSADAANAVTGTSNGLLMEGATADANETTVTLTDPTADRTITLPDATGTVAMTVGLGSTTGVYTAPTTTTTFTTADCGKIVGVATDAITHTLPDSTAGCCMTFTNTGAAGANDIKIDVDANDQIFGTVTLAASVVVIAGAAGDSITLTKATSIRGDSMTLCGVGSNVWNIISSTGIWADTN